MQCHFWRRVKCEPNTQPAEPVDRVVWCVHVRAAEQPSQLLRCMQVMLAIHFRDATSLTWVMHCCQHGNEQAVCLGLEDEESPKTTPSPDSICELGRRCSQNLGFVLGLLLLLSLWWHQLSSGLVGVCCAVAVVTQWRQ